MKGHTGVELTADEIKGQLLVLTSIPSMVMNYLDACEGGPIPSIAGFARWIQMNQEGGQS